MLLTRKTVLIVGPLSIGNFVLYSMLQSTRHSELAILSLRKGIGGIARKIGYQELLVRCNRAGEELFTECVAGSVGGLYEAGSI